MGKSLQKSSLVLSSTDLLRIRARALLELKNRETHGFRSFVEKVNPKFVWYKHCAVLGNVLERITTGELKRVMIFEPPRHGKSEQASRLFPAYFMYRYPERKIGICSYAADIALGLSRDARDYYQRSERTIRADVTATREWQNPRGGVVWAAGVGGPITGRGFDLGILDDPVKNAEEAYSPTIRENQKQWWRSTFYTRAEPNAAIVIIQTRWHEDDLCGWLLQQEREEPQHWHIVVLEALKEPDKLEIPDTCTIEPDWLKPGEALCPERYDERLLASIKGQAGSRFWSALYQQRPVMQSGDIWKDSWFKEISAADLPPLRADGTDWDTAYTEDEDNAASAFIRSAVDDQGNMYVLDLGFEWLEFPQMIELMKKQKAPHYIERKASGKSAKQTLVNNGIAAIETDVSGDKEQRTILATPFVERGNVFIVRGLKDKLLNDPRQGILAFPKGPFRDLNDAFVQAVNRHFKRGKLEFVGASISKTTVNDGSRQDPDKGKIDTSGKEQVFRGSLYDDATKARMEKEKVAKSGSTKDFEGFQGMR